MAAGGFTAAWNINENDIVGGVVSEQRNNRYYGL